MPLDDLTLVKKCRAGDRGAFRVLVERYQRRAYAQALGMLKESDDAMEVAQEAFLKVYKYLEHFKGESSFSTWLHRIVANACIDRLRRAPKRVHAVELGELQERLDRDEVDTEGLVATRLGTDPEETLLRGELAGKLEEALAELPEKHREILVLRELEGLSYEELAQTLRIPKGTVMSRLFHARARMQERLARYMPRRGQPRESGAE